MMDASDQSVDSIIIKYLVAHTKCSGCGHRYDPDDVQVHDHRGHIWLASVTCRHCGLQGLIMAAIKTEEEQEIEPTMESGAVEWPAFQQMGPISTDEVLDLHCFLQEFHGDVARLLEKHDSQA